MKGDSTTKIYPPHSYGNYDSVKMGQEPVGPYQVWRNRLTGSKMKLPVGTTGGKNWEKMMSSSYEIDYKLGQHVCFVDENQCEVRGIVRDKTDYPDMLVLKIELDDNAGWYDAKLQKR